jgi:hypothetical protein
MKVQSPARPKRWRYCLNALVLTAPAWFLYTSLTPVFPPAWESRTLGTLTVTPTPHDDGEPYRHDGQRVKDFSFRFCEGCDRNMRLAAVHVGNSPASPAETETGLVHGHGALKEAHVPYPEQVGASDRLWLSVQTWDGTVHHASWPLRREP